MVSIEPSKMETSSLEDINIRLWDEAVKIVLEPDDSQRLSLFHAFGNREGFDPVLAGILPSLCAFMEDSLNLFMKLNDSDRDTWLNEARSCGEDVTRFADTLQKLRRQRFGSS